MLRTYIKTRGGNSEVNVHIGKTWKSLMDMRNQPWIDMKGAQFLTRCTVTVDEIVLACLSEN